MLSITKLQNLKAIHNQSQSQAQISTVVINHKTTKFENNSQRATHTPARRPRCYQSQNCKIWKQFTTQSTRLSAEATMLSITKLQNLKAVHNRLLAYWVTFFVVINHKTTKFESNSQRLQQWLQDWLRCYQSQNYKIWKQFTTTGLVKTAFM